jgi:hypothetical protein
MSIDEIIMTYVIHFVVPPLDDPPCGATDIQEAIIAAARRHGSNGRGKHGVAGYIRMLAQIKCKRFDRWVMRAMDEQVKGRSPRSTEEVTARLRERGLNIQPLRDLASVMKLGILPREKEPSSLAMELEEAMRYIKSQPTNN